MIAEVNAGLRSRDEIHKREGTSFDEVLAQKEYEELKLQQSAKRIAQAVGISDIQAVRNALASTGEVQEQKKEND